jgi:hypothetical protein
LPEPAVEVVHRVRTDPGCLGEGWYREVIACGLSPEQYVEIVSVVAHIVAVDTMARALGLDAPALLDPEPGALVAFAEAALGDDDIALMRARVALQAVLGLAGLVDAAGVIGLFNPIDHVADATGIPLEPENAAATADFRAALDLDRFAVASRT